MKLYTLSTVFHAILVSHCNSIKTGIQNVPVIIMFHSHNYFRDRNLEKV